MYFKMRTSYVNLTLSDDSKLAKQIKQNSLSNEKFGYFYFIMY